MKKFLAFVGSAWALPLTLLALIYVGIFSALGWYNWCCVKQGALVWTLSSKAPRWLHSKWKKMSGHAFGQVVVLKFHPSKDAWAERMFMHEYAHVKQSMRLGALHPIIYIMTNALIRIGTEHADPRYDNWLEIDARRSAGEIVDIVGVLNKIKHERHP